MSIFSLQETSAIVHSQQMLFSSGRLQGGAYVSKHAFTHFPYPSSVRTIASCSQYHVNFLKVEIAYPAEVSQPLADFLDAKLSLYQAQCSSGKLGTPSFKATYALSHRSLHKSPLFASKVPSSLTFSRFTSNSDLNPV